MSDLFDVATLWVETFFGASHPDEIAKFAADYAAAADYARDNGEKIPTPEQYHVAVRLAEVEDGIAQQWVLTS